jgi:oxygen-independent coproporphyrinogen-3 oxidase
VIDRIAGLWSVAPDVEITLEANPNSAEQARFADLRIAGVNRVSIGIQSLDDAALRMLGRAHDGGEARRAIAHAAAVFERFSFDLIYARPGQTTEAWRRELHAALALAGDHLSLYQLTFEPGTRFEQLRRRGALVPLDDDTAHAMFELTQDALAARGLAAYEISNHARPGHESRHNLGYWRYEDYLGVGPGAHGRLTLDGIKHALRTERAPETWIAQVRARGDGLAEDVTIMPEDAAREALVMGLRLTEGIDAARFRRTTGVELEAALAPRGLERALDGGFIARKTEGGLVATAAGRQVLNTLLAEIAR